MSRTSAESLRTSQTSREHLKQVIARTGLFQALRSRLRGVVEGTGEDLVPIGIEIQ